MFQSLLKYFEAFRTTANALIMAWKSKHLSDESIKFRARSDDSLNPKLNQFDNPKFWGNVQGSFLTTDMSFSPNEIINLDIVFEIKS